MGLKVNALFVERAKAGKVKAGRYRADDGLYLRVDKKYRASWQYRYTDMGGKRHWMGLGSLKVIGLAAAREKATKPRYEVAHDIDPLAVRRSLRAATRKAFEDEGTSFKEFAEPFIKDKSARWQSSLVRYAYPVIGSLALPDVERRHIFKILEPIWATKSETARRVRGRIELILDAAIARGLKEGENPARLKIIQAALGAARPPVQHRPAMAYKDVPDFMDDLRGEEGLAPRALELAILTATRSGEVLNATWDEFDLKKKVWIISKERMKAGREHRIPLSPRAVAFLSKIKEMKLGHYVFPGMKKGRPLSGMSMLMLLRRMNRDDVTVHGFRSSFRDWCAEKGVVREIAEAALAHVVGGVEGAYFRSDLFEARRKVMNDWGRFADG